MKFPNGYVRGSGKYGRFMTDKNYVGTYYLIKNISETRQLAVAEARFYETPATTYCSVWVRQNFEGTMTCHGVGKASGYGYDRQSAALQSAMEDAGVEFNLPEDRFDSAGMSYALDVLQSNLEPVVGKLCRLHSHA